MSVLQQRAVIPTREFRRFGMATVETRKGDSETSGVDITGYASVTGEPYTVTDMLGEYQETIEVGAFKKTLADNDDVRFLYNHEGMPLARSKSGTLRLAEDDTGLKVDASLDMRSSASNALVVAIERGDVDEMSFSFRVMRQEWNDDYTERWIREVKLYDVSAVTFPANPATSVKMRAADFLLNNLTADQATDFMAHYRQQDGRGAETSTPMPRVARAMILAGHLSR